VHCISPQAYSCLRALAGARERPTGNILCYSNLSYPAIYFSFWKNEEFCQYILQLYHTPLVGLDFNQVLVEFDWAIHYSINWINYSTTSLVADVVISICIFFSAKHRVWYTSPAMLPSVTDWAYFGCKHVNTPKPLDKPTTLCGLPPLLSGDPWWSLYYV